MTPCGSMFALWYFNTSSHNLPLSKVFQNQTFQRQQTQMSWHFLRLLPVWNQRITCDMSSYSTHQSRQTAGYIWCFDTSWPAKCQSVTVVPRTSVHEDRSQIILRVRLNGSSLPFQALLWEHRWLALCLKPALPGTGTSASSWLCTLLHSDDFFQVLPSSLFWLAYDLVCPVSLPCLQPPGKEGPNKDPVLQR